MGGEELHGLHQKIVEVHRIVLVELLVIEAVDLSGRPGDEVCFPAPLAGLLVHLGGLQEVLGVGDQGGDGPVRDLLGVYLLLLQALADKAPRIVRVVDRKAGVKA